MDASSSTRMRILEVAQDEMYRNGYQGMRIETILRRTQLAKGALYHHFPSKLALGYAVVDEFHLSRVEKAWEEALSSDPNPIAVMLKLIDQRRKDIVDLEVFNGCPINNLVQEMGALDSGFQARLLKLHQVILEKFTQCIRNGQDAGLVKRSLDAKQIALFFIAAHNGIMGIVKCMQAADEIPGLFASLADYARSLAPQTENT
ncbi:MAG: TetR/AcrR family transcriptional regulator [Cellvibrio sp.]